MTAEAQQHAQQHAPLDAQYAELLSRDALDEAEAAAIARVKAVPGDARARLLLADLAVLNGKLDRADAQLALAADLVPEDAVGIGLLRTQLRGIFAREKWFAEGAMPSFPQGPTASDEAALKLGLALMARDGAAAAAALETLEAARAERAGTWNGRAAEDIRDLDDRFGHAVEAISSGGDYLWIDLALVTSITFEPPRRIRELAWRRARISLADGASADVLVPAVYPGAGNEAERLARVTDWHEAPGGLTTGSGQRAYLAGDAMEPVMEAQTITFAPPADSGAGAHG
ncbi:MAG: type VI secretion system accessory protein TagJ [Pseudomonadota bacterium]